MSNIFKYIIEFATNGQKFKQELGGVKDQAKAAEAGIGKMAGTVKNDMKSAGQAMSAFVQGDFTALPGLFRAAASSSGLLSKGLKGIKVALISTGIGALFVALGTAVGALTRYFKGTEEGEIVLKKVMNNISAYVEPVLQLFGSLGKAVVELFKGNFASAWDTAKSAFKQVGNQIETNKTQLGELNKLEEENIKNKRKYLLENKKLEAEIAEARLKAENEDNFNAKQRLAFAQQAIDKQKQLAQNKMKMADDELRIEQIKASFGDNDIATNDRLAELESEKFSIMQEQNTALKRISETQQRISREVNKTLQARRDEIAAMQKLSEDIDISIKAENAKAPDMPEFDTQPELDLSLYFGPLDELNKKLEELYSKQSTALSPEQWQAYQAEIVATQAKINEFTSVAADSAMTISDQYALLANSASQFGNAIGGAAGNFFSFAANMLNMLPQLITQITALGAAQVSSSLATTSAKQGEALASGIASSQKVPFPLNLIALAATVASIVASFANIKKFETGGIVGGSSFYGDKQLIRVNSGEEVLRRDDPRHALNYGTVGTRGGSDRIIIPTARIRKGDIYISYNEAAREISKRT